MLQVKINNLKYFLLILWFLFLGGSQMTPQAFAAERPKEELKEVGVNAVLGQQISTDLIFQDSTGADISISKVLETGRPVIVVPVYYQCPRLCGFLLNGFVDALNELISERGLKLGQDFSVVTVSFSSSESYELAAKREVFYKAKLHESSEESLKSWHFLADPYGNSKALMQELGFKYKKDKQDFSHTAAIFILNIKGVLSQYFTGIDFPTWDLKLALVDAAMGGVGSAIDHVLLYCYRFDPLKGKYTFAINSIIRVVGVLSLLIVGGAIYYGTRRRKRIS